MEQREPVSMKEISRLTGVSVATVSRVINNNGRFSEATRKRIELAVDKLEYTPNAMARALRTNRTKNIGIIVPDITNEFFSRLALNIQRKLFEAGYSTLIYNTDENAALEKKHLQMLISQSVSGIIFIAGGGYQDLLRIPDVPIVFLDRSPHLKDTRSDYVRIQTDHIRGGYLAGEALVQGGCRNPAILMYKQNLSSQADRASGFKQALRKADIFLKDCAVYHVDWVSYEDAYAAIQSNLAKGFNYDGLFCTTDWLAIGAMYALLDNGYTIPEQVKLIGFDDISISQYCRIPLTTIHQDIGGMSGLAVEIMLALLRNEKPERYDFFFEPSLTARGTV